MLVGVSLLLLSVGAIAILFSPDGRAVTFAAGLTATAFAVMGAVALIWGAAHVGASVLLRRRQPAAVLTLGLAVVNLLVLPFGTALGAYALWILLTNDGRRLFEPGQCRHFVTKLLFRVSSWPSSRGRARGLR